MPAASGWGGSLPEESPVPSSSFTVKSWLGSGPGPHVLPAMLLTLRAPPHFLTHKIKRDLGETE